MGREESPIQGGPTDRVLPDKDVSLPIIPEHGGLRQYQVATGKVQDNRKIVDLSQNLCPFLPEKGWLENALRELATDPAMLKTYPDPDYTELRGAVAKRHGIDAEQVLATNGASEGLVTVLRSLREDHGVGELVVPVPSFSEYGSAGSSVGIKVITIKRPHGAAGSWLLELAKDLPPRSALIVGHPNNPDGSIFSERAIYDATMVLQNKSGFLVLDEAFIELVVGGESMATHIVELTSLIILKSYTKVFSLPGVRFGAVVSSAENVQKLRQLLPQWNVNALAEHLMLKLLGMDRSVTSECAEKIARVREDLTARLSCSDDVRVHPSKANFILLEILSGMTAHVAQGLLFNEGFLVRDCSNFEGLTKKYIRIAVPAPEDLGPFLNALERCGVTGSMVADLNDEAVKR